MRVISREKKIGYTLGHVYNDNKNYQKYFCCMKSLNPGICRRIIGNSFIYRRIFQQKRQLREEHDHFGQLLRLGHRTGTKMHRDNTCVWRGHQCVNGVSSNKKNSIPKCTNASLDENIDNEGSDKDGESKRN